jgi:AcrR family transcriptional regulator
MSNERATRMLILSSARTLFSEKGYDATPVEEICALAGVAKGTFFYHFENKQYIVRHILAAQLAEYRDKLREQMDTMKDALARAEYYIGALVEQNDACGETRAYFKGEAAEWYQTVVGEERMKALYPLLEEVVMEGVSEGYFRVKYPSICATIAFMGIDAYLHRSGCGEEARGGIREIAAKALGIRESALAI